MLVKGASGIFCEFDVWFISNICQCHAQYNAVLIRSCYKGLNWTNSNTSLFVYIYWKWYDFLTFSDESADASANQLLEKQQLVQFDNICRDWVTISNTNTSFIIHPTNQHSVSLLLTPKGKSIMVCVMKFTFKRFGYGQLIPFYTLLGMWLPIHAGIIVEPC